MPTTIQPLAAFTHINQRFGEVNLRWTLPNQLLPPTYPEDPVVAFKVYIFKKRTSAVLQETIDEYFDAARGTPGLTPEQLAAAGVVVFWELANDQNEVTDFRVRTGEVYHYTAVIAYQGLGAGSTTGVSTILTLNTTIAVNFKVDIPDTKTIVVQAIETVLDRFKSATTGQKILLERDIKVHRDHARDKNETLWIVVQRTTGQASSRYLSGEISQFEGKAVLGESTIHQFTVEWICTQNPVRRDTLTNILQLGTPIARHYILKMGRGLIQNVDIRMNGDSEGRLFDQEPAIRGMMSIILTTEGRLETQAEVGSTINYITDVIEWQGDQNA